ncbi:hypothetical protein A2U01_0091448, partial [Trifolium medium]|nr:hypothetical protein [Trifolium medium]
CEKNGKSSRIVEFLVCLGRKAPDSGRKAPVAAGFCMFCLLSAQRAGRAAHCAGFSGKCHY